MTTPICPACASDDITRHEKVSSGKLTLGAEFTFNEIYYTCNLCHEEGDFTGESDKNYLHAQKDAQAQLVKDILDDMNKVGITMAMFERVFELPSRTLTRWKNGDFSSSTLALLRIIATYPWIIGVAENRFERNYASFVVIKVGVEELEKSVHPITSYSTSKVEKKQSSQLFMNKQIETGA
ncbi:MAG TPA: hypothetical protein VLI69_07890 [Gammaproteobacteria bacterium]|nr:hypothetical protein [Gammaproteobacteria bacterium]